jgi:hypothetical protein
MARSCRTYNSPKIISSVRVDRDFPLARHRSDSLRIGPKPREAPHEALTAKGSICPDRQGRGRGDEEPGPQQRRIGQKTQVRRKHRTPRARWRKSQIRHHAKVCEHLGIKLEKLLETSHSVDGVSNAALGSYVRKAVEHYEGTYLTIRPRYASPEMLKVYLTKIYWDDAHDCLSFEEMERGNDLPKMAK